MVRHLGQEEEGILRLALIDPVAVFGGAGLVMFGMAPATGLRIPGRVDFKQNRYNGLIVAVSPGIGLIPLIAPEFTMWLPHAIEPLIHFGILLASVSAVVLNMALNGTRALSGKELAEAAMPAEGGH